MKSLGSSASDSCHHHKPSNSTVKASTQPATAAETNGPAQVASVRIDASNVDSRDVESDSETESEDSEETSSSESTVSADDNRTAEDTAFTSHSQRTSSSPAVW